MSTKPCPRLLERRPLFVGPIAEPFGIRNTSGAPATTLSPMSTASARDATVHFRADDRLVARGERADDIHGTAQFDASTCVTLTGTPSSLSDAFLPSAVPLQPVRPGRQAIASTPNARRHRRAASDCVTSRGFSFTPPLL